MCALCRHPRCVVEHLAQGWLFCGFLGFRYRLNQQGEAVMVGETQHSLPRKFGADPKPIIAYAKPKR